MTASPIRIPLFDRVDDHQAVASGSESNTPLEGLKFNWKTPILKRSRATGSAPLNIDEDDEEDDGMSAPLPSLPTPNWKTHYVSVRSEDKSEVELPMSSFCYEDLESVLIEEEEYGVPEHNRHRTETGLAGLDSVLSDENHEMLDEETDEKGLACGSILEVAGTPGSGKTTLLIQMAVLERLRSLLRASESAKAKSKMGERSWKELGEIAQQVMLIGE
jgi:hypothetical protein